MNIELKLEPGKSGVWEVSRFHIGEREAKLYNLRCLINGIPNRAVTEGDYWMLTENGEIYMSNTPAEIQDHLQFINNAHGRVLIAGLGLGMVVQALIDKGRCSRIVVVEKSIDVINLVGKVYKSDLVEIVHSDIIEYKPTEHFDYAWFDIWKYICGDNYNEMKKLYKKFARNATHMYSWMHSECKRLNNSNK